MLLDVDRRTVARLLLLARRFTGGLLGAQLLFDPLGQMRVNVLGQVVLPIETLAAFGTPVHLVRTVNDRVPLQMFLFRRRHPIISI